MKWMPYFKPNSESWLHSYWLIHNEVFFYCWWTAQYFPNSFFQFNIQQHFFSPILVFSSYFLCVLKHCSPFKNNPIKKSSTLLSLHRIVNISSCIIYIVYIFFLDNRLVKLKFLSEIIFFSENSILYRSKSQLNWLVDDFSLILQNKKITTTKKNSKWLFIALKYPMILRFFHVYFYQNE